MIVRRPAGWLLVVLSAVLLSSCRAPVDVRANVEIVEVTSGWFDVGIVGGMNKVVPSVSFRLRKPEDVRLDGLSLNILFRHPPAEGAAVEDEWDDVFVQNVAFTEGNQTPVLTVRTERGYTGEQARLELLQHSQFRGVRARIFARSGSPQWAELGTIEIERQLLTTAEQ